MEATSNTNRRIGQPGKQPSAMQFEIAELLHSLSHGLKKDVKRKAGYITLDEQIGPSKRHKNAVSILPGHVRFTLSDSCTTQAQIQAEQFDPPLSTQKNEDRKKLVFVRLQPSDIRNHPDFFRDLLNEAQRESRYRQEH